MRKFINSYVAWLFLLILVPAAVEVAAMEPAEVITARTAWSADRAHPGDHVKLAIIVNIADGFHINPDKPQVVPAGDLTPYPTSVKVLEASEALTIESVYFPPAEQINVGYAEGPLMTYEGQKILFMQMKVDEQAQPGMLALKFTVAYQACDAQSCLFPEQIALQASLDVVETGQAVLPINKEWFAGFDAGKGTKASEDIGFDLFGWTFSIDVSTWLGLIMLLLVAVLGGALLNFTPCVLPVIPIKIISLSNVSENRRKCFTLGLSMSLGVVAFWLVLGVLIAMISEFTATNQLFQYPAFTILVGIIIGLMAIGMWELYNIRLPSFIYTFNPSQESVSGSFGLGIMTAILSTPCTAPFMGAAAAWAATQKPITTLATFIAIGIGMALPYLLLSTSPQLLSKMPRTGPASNLIKQVMGLLMFAAAAYFIGTGLSALFSTPPDPPGKGHWWVVMGFCAIAGCWLVYGTIKIAAGRKVRIFFVGVGLVLLSMSVFGGLRLTHKGPVDWVYYTPERFAEAVQQGKVVVMDFTAEWCLNCKALEHSVLESNRIIDLLAAEDVVPIKVDITGSNPPGKAKLKAVGRLTIPLLVIYSSSGEEIFKSDFYTVEQVLRAVDMARRSKSI